jgi:hypothetical protein
MTSEPHQIINEKDLTFPKVNGDEKRCPRCLTSWQGSAIPQEYIDKGYYAPGSTHYSLLIGVEIQGVYDGVIYFCCPHCKTNFPRFDKSFYEKRLIDLDFL